MKRLRIKTILAICAIILLGLNLLNSFSNLSEKTEIISNGIKKYYSYINKSSSTSSSSLIVPMRLLKTETIHINENLSTSTFKMTQNRILSKLTTIQEEKYLIKINSERINKLFQILYAKENLYGNILNNLKLISFSSLINKKYENISNNKTNNTSYSIPNYNEFNKEIKKYLEIDKKKILAKPEFVQFLLDKSDKYSFNQPRNNVKKAKIKEENKPVFVTAANSDYFDPLQATVDRIHSNFPDFKLIIYDLGLKSDQLELVNPKKYLNVALIFKNSNIL
jgi:hypothetical protein